MTYGAAPVLETDRLRLRAHSIGDFDAILAMWRESGLLASPGGDPPRTEDVFRRTLSAIGCWALLGYGYWVVERRNDGAVIGQAGLADFRRDMAPSIAGLPELGYVFAAAARGQGHAAEAGAAILAWADEQLDARETVAVIAPGNAASIRVAEKCGFAVRETAIYRDEPVLLFRRRR